MLHQIGNTFGDQIACLLPVDLTEMGGDGSVPRRERRNRMQVSPFLAMRGGCRFAFTPPEEERFALSIRYGAAAPRLTATMRPFSDAALVGRLLPMPSMTVRAVAAIHWQALRIWLRGAVYHPHAAGGAA